MPLVVLVPLLGVADKTLFLAARSEHYWVTIACFVFASAADAGSPAPAYVCGSSAQAHAFWSIPWVGPAKAVQLALWFWAGVSKLNHHFASVVCVMTSNSPFTRISWFRRALYRRYPDDLRPSRLAQAMAHGGATLEFSVPTAFLLTPLGTPPVVAIVLMLALHTFITSNIPMGVPLEWNVMVVYGGFFLFWAHPDVSLAAVHPPALGAFLVVMLVVLPIVGNIWPARLSFLLSMRYYAGNWACSVWLFRGEAYRKLDRLTKSSPWIHDQLDRLYDHAVSVGLFGKIMAFRLLHLHGRAIAMLLPKAVPRLEGYEWVDGEAVAGLALGWNFGDGHLHHEQLLGSLQQQCGFEEGELRCIFVESQALGGSTLAYRIADAKAGPIEAGEVTVDELRARQPWGAVS
jgi:hypothetical protein